MSVVVEVSILVIAVEAMECDGRGSIDCNECDGDGKLDCPECDGEGEVDCEDCDAVMQSRWVP